MTEGWTRADQAELDAILWFFLERYYAHQPCRECRALNTWCPPLSEAWAAVEAWRHTRMLLSRAEHLRACRNLLQDAKKVRPGLDAQSLEAHNGIRDDPL